MRLKASIFLLVVSCICCISGSPVDQDSSQPSAFKSQLGSITYDSSRCTDSLTNGLTFVTSLSIRGCPVFVHRVGAVKAGRFVLEPTFCITEQSALSSPSAHFDLLTNEFYFSFPVNVIDENLTTEVASMLGHLSPKSVSFLEVTSVQLSSDRSLAFTNATFLWGPNEFVGHLRLICNDYACPSLAMFLSKYRMEVFDGIRITASMRVVEGCVKQTFPVTIARAPFLPIKSMQRSWTTPMRSCSDLQLFKVVQLDNCTAYVHQRRRKTGDFVIEPLLCPSPNFQLLRDFSLGSHYVRLPAVVEDASVIAAVRSQMGSVSIESISFMKLWDASIHVTSRLSRWRFESLRLSVDRRSAELRAYCTTLESCELLVSVLQSETVNFWKEIQWTASFLFSDYCELHYDRRRFVFRQRERSAGLNTKLNESLQLVEALRNRTVERSGRTFVIVMQRTCKRSDFSLFWEQYVAGFGDKANFWIGLEVMHRLTNPQDATLRVEMLLWNETEWFAEYSGFSIGNVSTGYKMNYTSMIRDKSSLLYDAMASSKGYKFTTRDVDNDGHSSAGYCSQSWAGSGGWWYSGCGTANPTGVYSFSETTSSANSVWYFNEGFKALKEFRMLIQV